MQKKKKEKKKKQKKKEKGLTKMYGFGMKWEKQEFSRRIISSNLSIQSLPATIISACPVMIFSAPTVRKEEKEKRAKNIIVQIYGV